jgi:SatD family (SatD)
MGTNEKPRAVRATLIGDVTLSRQVDDRDSLQRSIDDALRLVNQALGPAQTLQVTLGDEFQGAFEDVRSAARASLLLRLQLLKGGGVESRYGIGFGLVTVYEEERAPFSQDGPGWWSARDAIHRAVELRARPHTAFLRTRFEAGEGGEEIDAEMVNAFLVCRDALVSGMSERSQRLLLGRLLGRQQAELAIEEGISQSAVSQNLATSGAHSIVAADAELAGWPS